VPHTLESTGIINYANQNIILGKGKRFNEYRFLMAKPLGKRSLEKLLFVEDTGHTYLFN
jgi:hypothetical protein